MFPLPLLKNVSRTLVEPNTSRYKLILRYGSKIIHSKWHIKKVLSVRVFLVEWNGSKKCIENSLGTQHFSIQIISPLWLQNNPLEVTHQKSIVSSSVFCGMKWI